MGSLRALVDALNEQADELSAAAERRGGSTWRWRSSRSSSPSGLTWAVSRSITRPLRASPARPRTWPTTGCPTP